MNITNKSQIGFGTKISPELTNILLSRAEGNKQRRIAKAIAIKIDEVSIMGSDKFELGIGTNPVNSRAALILSTINRNKIIRYFLRQKSKSNLVSVFLSLRYEDIKDTEDAIIRKIQNG